MGKITKEESIKILADLIKIKSVNDNEVEVAEYLKQLFGKYGINAEVIKISDTRANLVAEVGTGHPILAVSGHMDVVSPGNLEAWDSDPFELTEKDGKLFGRGVTDMKAGLAALVISMINLKEENLIKHGTIRLLATMGEEVGEQGSSYFYKHGYMKDADGLLIAEPSTIYGTAAKQKGSFDLKITSKGKAVHSSTPQQGYNALNPLISLLDEANEYFNNLPSGKMGKVGFNIDILNGGSQINSLPDSAEASINVRTIPEYDNAKIADKLATMIKKYNDQGADIKMETIMDEVPVDMSSENKLVKAISSIGKDYANRDIVVTALPGITDASNLAKDKPEDFPFAVYGPGNMTQHQINESLPKKMYFDFIDIDQKLFINFLNNAK